MKVRLISPFDDAEQIWIGLDEPGMRRKVFRFVSPETGSEEFMAGITIFEPGESSSYHVHPESEEINLVLERLRARRVRGRGGGVRPGARDVGPEGRLPPAPEHRAPSRSSSSGSTRRRRSSPDLGRSRVPRPAGTSLDPNRPQDSSNAAVSTQSGTAPDGEPGPLADLRVLELGTLIAGPFAGRVLADFGAEVIKIEHPARATRSAAGARRWNGTESLWHLVQSRGKRSVAADLHDPRDQALVRALAAESDVLIENFRPGPPRGMEPRPGRPDGRQPRR